MDQQTPDVSTFFGATPPQGGVQSTAYQAPTTVPDQGTFAPLSLDDSGKKKSRLVFIVLGVLVLVVLVVTALVIFFTANSQDAAASQYQFTPDGAVIQDVGRSRTDIPQPGDTIAGLEVPADEDGPSATPFRLPTTADGRSGDTTAPADQRSGTVDRRAPAGQSPTPFPLQPSKTPIPSRTPSPIPTFPNVSPTRTPVARPTAVPWEVSFDQRTYSLDQDLDYFEIPGFGMPILDGLPPFDTDDDQSTRFQTADLPFRVTGPLLGGEFLCIDLNKTFMTIKKDAGSVERLCDYFAEDLNAFDRCLPYQSGGVVQTIELPPPADPSTNCFEGEGPEPGTYILKAEVYYDCSQPEVVSCRSSKELFSSEVRITQ